MEKLWYKKKSLLHGSGLFALSNIKKGEVLCFSGHHIHGSLIGQSDRLNLETAWENDFTVDMASVFDSIILAIRAYAIAYQRQVLTDDTKKLKDLHESYENASQKYEFEHGRGDAAFRNTMLDTYYELGVDPTQEEKEYAKLSSGETTAEAVATMPKLIAEFAIANILRSSTNPFNAVSDANESSSPPSISFSSMNGLVLCRET